jgi:hypothetical protein
VASTSEHRDYRPFIPECNKFGIGKTKAYELADAGLLETFLIGTKRYIYIDRLATLPERLAKAEPVRVRVQTEFTTQVRCLNADLARPPTE